MTPAERALALRSRIEAALRPIRLDIDDESHLHAGHAGARDGRGHYRVRIVSDRFAGVQRVERHRMVYAAVGDLLQTDIHALAVTALTPAEGGDPAG